MADTTRSLAALLALYADNTANDISAQDGRDFLVSAYKPQCVIPGGRLTLATGVSVTTTDVTGATNLYYTPHIHNCIGLYDGTSWTLHTFTQRSLAFGTLTDAKNYDVFLYDNSGTLTLELTAWTNDTTRATDLVLQDGVWCKTGALTRRYLGTIRTTSATTTEDSLKNRFVWNAYNRTTRPLLFKESTESWNYNSTTLRPVRGDTTAATRAWVQVVVGLPGASAVSLRSVYYVSVGTARSAVNAIAEDSTTTPDPANVVQSYATAVSSAVSSHAHGGITKLPAVGYHYYQLLEGCTTASSITFYGYTAAPLLQSGITGWVEG